MRLLNRTLEFAVVFAEFSNEQKIPANDLAQMILLARESAKAYARMDEKKEHKRAEEVEEIAKKTGHTVEWNRMWPTLVKGKKSFTLPSYD